MRLNMVGAFIRNKPFGTEIAFANGLRIYGVEVNEVDTSYPDQKFDEKADATIVFKWMEGYWEDLRRCQGPKIVYQPDDVAFPHIQQMMRSMREYCDYAFMYDDRGVRFAESLGYKKAQRLLLTADIFLYRPLPDVERDIDVSFIGSLTHGPNHVSRVRMCQIVSKVPGLKTYFRGDVYDIEEIVRIYNRSKVVLNHATDVGQPFGHGFGLQCRNFEAGFTGAAVLSNVIDNLDDGDPTMFWEFENEEDLVSQLRNLLAKDRWKVMGRGLYQELMETHQPKHRAAEIMEFVSSIQ